MHRAPRQASSSSSGAAPSSSVATTPAATSLGSIAATGSQTPSLSVSAATSGLLSSSTSQASSSTSAEPTTTSSSTQATSTLSPTSTSQSSTSAPTTTSTPTSSSSSSSSSTVSPTTTFTSSSVASSSSSSFSTTTAPPTSTSSQNGTPTTITSAFTTFVNGSAVVTSTTFPTTIPPPSSPSSSSNRTAIIAGSAAGGTALIILILSLAFCVRRKRSKKLDFLDTINLKRRLARSRADLLDGEDVDAGLPPRGYTDYETPWDGHVVVTRETPGTSASRWSGASSAFREDVWPAPHEGTRLMDPLANRDDVDLGRIVDEVMGPSPTARHYSDQSVSSVYRGSVTESEGVVHSRTVSNASNAALLDAAGLGGTTGTGPTPNAPVRSSPLAQQGIKPDSVEHQGENTS